MLAATGERALVAELPEAEVAALAAQAGRRSADDLQRFFRLLLEADEALAAPARSVDPKLVLEMCVVRLATLPPLLPLDDILHRLEAFGAGNPAAPGGGAARENVPRPREAAPGGGLWDRFLARVQEEKLVAPYMMLLSGTLLAADGEALRIGIDNEAARRELSRKETLQRLRAIASEGRASTPARRRSRRLGGAPRRRSPTRWCRPRSRSSAPRCAVCGIGAGSA